MRHFILPMSGRDMLGKVLKILADRKNGHMKGLFFKFRLMIYLLLICFLS